MTDGGTAVVVPPSSPESGAGTPFGSLRGKKVRKYSENDGDLRAGIMHIEPSKSQVYSKVPLNPIEPNINGGAGEVNLRRQASLRIKKMSSCHDGSSRFPKLNDCAHFHYDNVELGHIQLSMHDDPEHEEYSLFVAAAASSVNGIYDEMELPFTVRVCSTGKQWLVKRCYEDFRVLDKQLHSCIYDRRFSQLVELPKGETMSGNREAVKAMLSHYLVRFSQIAGDMINCGPVLNWIELDNHGNHVVASEESAINIPAVAAAHVVKRYMAQAPDEISIEVGDMISVIDMPPPEDTAWWRGKNRFEVGFFPRQCVELISEMEPQDVDSFMGSPKPVLRKHGKLITFLRSFILARPTRRGLKQRGILRERVFGCDLGEHLLNSGQDVPEVVKICTEFIEKYGIVDGIYRLSGVTSNIQYLRDEFDSEKIPDLKPYEKDIHCMTSVCKLFFRELPNPLLTYQLYNKFEDIFEMEKKDDGRMEVAAVENEDERLVKMHDTVQQLPPPHYRTLKYIIQHLARMATYGGQTGMNIKNLAIVWAPNLLKSKELCDILSTAAFVEIKIQATVVEYLIRNHELIFNDKLFPDVPGIGQEMQRPKSLVLSTPTKLLSLEEARARSTIYSETEEKPKFIEVGGGPAALPKQYHTVLEYPRERKRSLTKSTKKSPGWKGLFHRKSDATLPESPPPKSKQMGGIQRMSAAKHRPRSLRNSLRSVRSAESLSSADSHLELRGDLRQDLAEPRRNSVACTADATMQHAASHNSFFEPDDLLKSSATSRNGDHDDDEDDEIFVDARETLDDQPHHHSGSSPQWIDQSSSSIESVASPRNPGNASPRDISMVIGMRTERHRRQNEQLSARAVMEETQQEVERLNSPTRVGHIAVGHSVSTGIARSQPISTPRREVKSMDVSPHSISPTEDVEMMEVSNKLSPRYRRKYTGPESPNSRRGSVFDKISRVVSMKTKTKAKRTSSTGGESPTTQSRGVQSYHENDEELSSGIAKVLVSAQSLPLPNSGDEDNVVHMRVHQVNSSPSNRRDTQDANVQTLNDDFSHLEENANEYALLGNLDDALLGSTNNRPRSNSRPRSMAARISRVSTDSDPFRDSSFGSDTRLSLDNVILEYDHVMEKYSNRAITPECDTNTDDESTSFRNASGSVSSSHSDSMSAGAVDGFQPIPDLVSQLNTNCNHARVRKQDGVKKSVHFALNTNDKGPKDDDGGACFSSADPVVVDRRSLTSAISKPVSLAFPNERNDDPVPSGGSEDVESETIFARFGNEMAAVEASKASPEIDRLTPDTFDDDRTEEMNREFVLRENITSAQISIGVGGRHDSSETNNSESVSSSNGNGVCDISVLPEDQIETEQLVSPTSSLCSQSPCTNGAGGAGPIGIDIQSLDSPDRISVSADSCVEDKDVMPLDCEVNNEGVCSSQQDMDSESDPMCYGASAKGCCSQMQQVVEEQDECIASHGGSESQEGLDESQPDYAESQAGAVGFIELQSDYSESLDNNESQDFDQFNYGESHHYDKSQERCNESQDFDKSNCGESHYYDESQERCNEGYNELEEETPSMDCPLIDSSLIDSPLIDSPLIDSPLIDSPETVGPISTQEEDGTIFETSAVARNDDTVIHGDVDFSLQPGDDSFSSTDIVEL